MTTPDQPGAPTRAAGVRHFVQLGALRCHYLTWGEPARPAVVMLHGFGQSAHTWRRVARHLTDRYFVVAPDARGHGDSDWATDGDYGQIAMRDDVGRLAGALELSRFVLVGMSMGGISALRFAAQNPDRLPGLVVIDVSPTVEEEGATQLADFFSDRLEFDDLDDLVAYVRRFNPERSPEALRATLPANLRTLPDGRLGWKWDPALLGEPGSRLRERKAQMDELWAGVARITCPTLIVQGQSSSILRRENAERLARVIRQGRFVAIGGAGHTVQGDRPQDLASVVAEFLSEIGH
jgi:pimeloyl-ACP methyl ester carboxylesterase